MGNIDFKLLLDWAYKAITEHEAILGLVALAFIIAMPPALPGIIGRIETLQWGWKWLHDGLHLLVSLQHPSAQTSSVTETRTRQVSIETPIPPTVPPAIPAVAEPTVPETKP